MSTTRSTTDVGNEVTRLLPTNTSRVELVLSVSGGNILYGFGTEDDAVIPLQDGDVIQWARKLRERANMVAPLWVVAVTEDDEATVAVNLVETLDLSNRSS